MSVGSPIAAEDRGHASRRPSVLFLVTEDWYFWSHRLALARTLRDRGFRIIVATRERQHGERIRREGFELRPLAWRRMGDGVLGGVGALVSIWRLYRRERPDIVHHVALKPVLFGSVAAWLCGSTKQVNLFAGLGFIFVSPTLRASLQRWLILRALRFFAARPNAIAVVQNPDDRDELCRRAGFSPARVRLIYGSGLDLAWFQPMPEPQSPFTVALVARMLRYKGIGVMIEAAREIRRRGMKVRVVLAGPVDPDNPTSMSEAELRAHAADGAIEWLGPVADIREVWAMAHVAVYPTIYREGIPKALIEAAGSARAIIATDVPGCREIVAHGVNGLLVPPGNALALVEAIAQLAADPALCERMGREGRRHVESTFGDTLIASQFIAVYDELIAGSAPKGARAAPVQPLGETRAKLQTATAGHSAQQRPAPETHPNSSSRP